MENKIKRKIGVLGILGMFLMLALATPVSAPGHDYALDAEGGDPDLTEVVHVCSSGRVYVGDVDGGNQFILRDNCNMVIRDQNLPNCDLNLYIQDETADIRVDRYSDCDAAGNLRILADKVGIGTTSPGDKLDVNGDIRVRGADIKDAGGTVRITLTDNGRLDLKEDGGSTSLSIATDGKVGIGTTSPGATLHVMTSGADNHIRVQRAGSAPYMDICSGGAYCVLDCRNTWDEVFQIREDGTARLHIKKGGNVGIGTTSPDRILHIKDTSNPPLKYECTTATGKSGQDLYIPIDVNGTIYYIKLYS